MSWSSIRLLEYAQVERI